MMRSNRPQVDAVKDPKSYTPTELRLWEALPQAPNSPEDISVHYYYIPDAADDRNPDLTYKQPS